MEVTIRAHMPDSSIEEISHETLLRIADVLGLAETVPNRFSAILVMDMVHLQAQGVPAYHVLDEIRALENGRATATKPPSRFKNERLSALWHKHFFAPTINMVATNIHTEVGDRRLGCIVHKVCDPHMGKTITEEMIKELAQAVTVAPFEKRWARSAITGEWLIYSPQASGNIYLGACSHAIGDLGLIARLKAWELEFPSLAA